MPVLGYSGPLSEIPTELEGDNGGDNSSAGDSNGGGDSILTDGKNGAGDSNRENGSNGSNDACSYGSSGHLANEDSDGVQGQNEVTDDSSDEVSINEQVYNNEQDVESGKLAGLILKNALDAKEQHRKFELGQRWIALDPTAKAMKEDEGPVTLQAVEFWSSICDIEENISKPDWRQREAATYAFGFVLEGPSPEKLMTLINHALSFMLNALMKDPNNHMKDTTSWTLGRIFEFLHGSTFETPIITQANCQQIITVLLQSMRDVPNVAEKACGTLNFLAQGFKDAATDVSIDGLIANDINALQFGANADVSHCTNLRLVTLAELEEGC